MLPRTPRRPQLRPTRRTLRRVDIHAPTRCDERGALRAERREVGDASRALVVESGRRHDDFEDRAKHEWPREPARVFPSQQEHEAGHREPHDGRAGEQSAALVEEEQQRVACAARRCTGRARSKRRASDAPPQAGSASGEHTEPSKTSRTCDDVHAQRGHRVHPARIRTRLQRRRSQSRRRYVFDPEHTQRRLDAEDGLVVDPAMT